MKKSIKTLIAVLMIGTLAAGCSSAKDYVATVNGKKITQDEYKYFLMVNKGNIEQQSGAFDDESKKTLWTGKLQDKPAEEYAKEISLESAKEFKILEEKAEAAGYKADKKELESSNKEVDDYVKTLGEGEEGKKKYEKMYGMSPDLVKKMNEDILLINKYYEEEIKKVNLTDEELKKYYEDNIDAYKTVTVKHVLFLTTDQATGEALSKEKQAAAKKNAEDVLARVKKGEDIAELAKKYSEDGGSKDNGGEYTFTKGKMVKAFEDWSFSAKPGDTGIVQTEYGYHVIRLEKIGTFDDVKAQVKENLAFKKLNEELEKTKKDSKYETKKNDEIYNSIKVLS